MLSGSSNNFHIIVSDFKMFFVTLEAQIASGKRDISPQGIPCKISQSSDASVNIKTSISLLIELF
jgi:hypothetical protein